MTLKGLNKEKNKIEYLRDLLFPPDLYCICCGNFIDSKNLYGLCTFCFENINWNLEGKVRRGKLDVIKCMEYGSLERIIIFSLKYGKNRYISKNIGEIMSDKLLSIGNTYDIIVPVPMFRKKEQKRGFNQADLICKYMGKRLNIKVISSMLLRVKNTSAMRGLGPEERLINVRDSIKINPMYKGDLIEKKVLLVDDFFTTGATASACQEVLYEAKAEQVTIIAFAGR